MGEAALQWVEHGKLLSRFETNDHSTVTGPHTMSIVQKMGTDEFLGYIGPFTDGAIDIWATHDFQEWRPVGSQPQIRHAGIRWPSVITHEGQYYMCARDRVRSTLLPRQLHPFLSLHPLLFSVDRITRKVQTTSPSAIALWRSENGLNFDRVSYVSSPQESQRRYNQNPFLTTAISSGIDLVYYVGDEDSYEIRHKRASTPYELTDTPPKVLLQSNETIAAPAMVRLEGAYYLFTEELAGDTWITTVRVSESLNGFTMEDKHVLFASDQACAAPFAIDGRLVIWVSRRLKSGLFPEWVGELYHYPCPSQ